jgi:hypothetical protein
VALIGLYDPEGFRSTPDQVKALVVGLALLMLGLLPALSLVRAWLLALIHPLILRVFAVLGAWLAILVIALTGIELFTRNTVQYNLWNWSIKGR